MTALKWFKSRKGQQTLIILTFMIIPLALLFIFTYLPFGEMVKFSFYKMKYTTPVDKRVFVGLKNYAEVFRNKDIFASLKLSLYYMAGSIVQLALALYLATILSFKTKGGNFFKGLMFFPYLISVVILRLALSIPQTIALESTLSYLGLGLDVNTPSLGILLRNARNYFLQYPYLLVFPAVIVSLITITFYLVGNAFSDAADPRNHV